VPPRAVRTNGEGVVGEAGVVADLGEAEVRDGEVRDRPATLALRDDERAVLPEERVDDPAVGSEPHRVAVLDDAVPAEADHGAPDRDVELALRLVPGPAHVRPLRGEGAEGEVDLVEEPLAVDGAGAG